MKELSLIDEMLNLQNSLNIATCGNDWTKGFTKENRLIDFARCIYMECAELVDSMPWKHWKSINASWDLENIQIELVDIWHFILSLAIMQNKQIELKNTISDFKFYKTDKNLNEILEYSRELIHFSSAKIVNINDICNTFLHLTCKCDLEFNRLYKIYIGKNVLNKFRQDNGYKDGSYKKLWNGKEDNVILYELLEQDEINYDSLYKNLDDIYKNLKD
ncbi:dUTPase, dimeric [Campylobacter sp. RM5004]|uniref:dUTP diphosphatase n=1 Tax=Campylobacter sp. RM5004 TaxID=1660078 RepID=UPI001EFC1B5A|nr:dUTP diphosphatase [Campylobacter sp. RM5004]ULO00801.1 dUTPase, dimeric [Campylobacter sp. RM5004]